MNGRFVKRGKHTHRDCFPSMGHHGDIYECECGRRWRFNGDARQWAQTWPSVFGLRRHREVGP